MVVPGNKKHVAPEKTIGAYHADVSTRRPQGWIMRRAWGREL